MNIEIPFLKNLPPPATVNCDRGKSFYLDIMTLIFSLDYSLLVCSLFESCIFR